MTTRHMTVPGFLSSLPPRVRLRSFQDLRLKSHDYVVERMALLLHYNETLLREVHHRIGNSLQLIASILALDARKVHSQEARRHLEDAHRRILAVATVQRQLRVPGESERFDLSPYLVTLCQNLTASLVDPATELTIEVHSDSAIVSARTATDLGLIVTELVINALKHAFGSDGRKGRIHVSYRVDGRRWRLTVADDGRGKAGFLTADRRGLDRASSPRSLRNSIAGWKQPLVSTGTACRPPSAVNQARSIGRHCPDAGARLWRSPGARPAAVRATLRGGPGGIWLGDDRSAPQRP